MRNLVYLILLFFTLGLAGCATVPSQAPALNQKITWQERTSMLSQMQDWHLKAVVALRDNITNVGESAQLQWQQKQENYTIILFGPLGTDAVQLSGKPGYVTLETANGKKFTATTVEQLLLQQTGWQLPISNLYYWIRGLPAPQGPSQKQFDRYFHLTKLQQQGWTIQYLRYIAVNQLDVPSKILLENRQIKVKININQWQF